MKCACEGSQGSVDILFWLDAITRMILKIPGSTKYCYRHSMIVPAVGPQISEQFSIVLHALHD